MMAGDHRLGAVSICTPPVGRHAIAAAAIDAGLHVMLEKPPAATTTEISALADHARARGFTLFATWHSRAAAGVTGARDWPSDTRPRAAHIRWTEDTRRAHPGPAWHIRPCGFRDSQPGTNAMPLLTPT